MHCYSKLTLAVNLLFRSSSLSFSSCSCQEQNYSFKPWKLKTKTHKQFAENSFYCAFHKHANSKVQKPPSQLRFSLPSIIITITSNKPWNTETHKTDRNPPITNHKPWPFEPVKVKFCFLRGLLRWLTAAKNAIVSRLLNFRIHMFVKSAEKDLYPTQPQKFCFSFQSNLIVLNFIQSFKLPSSFSGACNC